MIRPIAFLIGLFFSGWLLVSFVFGAAEYIKNPPQETVEHKFHQKPEKIHLASDGFMGKFDRQQLQRGFQVYKEVCAACHSMDFIAFRNLEALGYNEAEVKAIAKNWAIETPSIDPNTGEPASRPSLPADYFPSPFANEVAARAANNNSLPPDLSLMTKARPDGSNYVYSLLTGYQAPPADLPEENKPGTGLHYNPYFPNLNLAMAPPLTGEGQVDYADGTKATVEQMATDVSAFLVWTAEPKLENRHQTGLAVLLFLLIATILAYLSYRNIWADKKH